MLNAVHKVAWAASTAGPMAAAKGLARLAAMTAMRPKVARFTTKEDIILEFNHPAQTPNLLLMAGQYVDPEYAFFASKGLQGWRVVDVGAGIGQFAIYMAKCGADIVAYEPLQANAARLWSNRRLNKVAFEIRQHALGARDGGYVSMVDKGLNSRVEGPTVGRTLECTTIDAQFPIDEIDLLKVNTAGTEWEVLHGASNMLRTRRVRYLCVLDGDRMRMKIPEIESYGYQWFTMAHDGRIWPIPGQGPIVKPSFCRHLLAVRREPMPLGAYA